MSAVMATLLARLDGHELELALDAVESESRRVSADADSPQVVSRLARLLALLPAARRLEAWQESIRLASLDIRRDFLRQLPMLVALVEPLDDNGLWSETANALVEVRRRWP